MLYSLFFFFFNLHSHRVICCAVRLDCLLCRYLYCIRFYCYIGEFSLFKGVCHLFFCITGHMHQFSGHCKTPTWISCQLSTRFFVTASNSIETVLFTDCEIKRCNPSKKVVKKKFKKCYLHEDYFWWMDAVGSRVTFPLPTILGT